MEVRITKLRVAMAALFVLAGIGLANLLSPLVDTALATAGQVVNISDRSGSAFFARVSSDGKLAVGDGAGPLSVDGTVSGRPAAPAAPWSATGNLVTPDGMYLAGPSSSPINITSISWWTDTEPATREIIALYGAYVPSSATTCIGATFVGQLWNIADKRPAYVPVSFTFPTPLQYKAPPNMKACLNATTTMLDHTRINAVGFYGG